MNKTGTPTIETAPCNRCGIPAVLTLMQVFQRGHFDSYDLDLCDGCRESINRGTNRRCIVKVEPKRPPMRRRKWGTGYGCTQ